jgi:hypothetical protein
VGQGVGATTRAQSITSTTVTNTGSVPIKYLVVRVRGNWAVWEQFPPTMKLPKNWFHRATCGGRHPTPSTSLAFCIVPGGLKPGASIPISVGEGFANKAQATSAARRISVTPAASFSAYLK